jgi:lipoprotein
MKTIKKHIGLWATMAALLTGACTTYPDDFGFSADLAETQVEYNAFRPTGYDITVKTPIANFDEGAGITKVGYTVNGEERHCDPVYSEADGCYCLTISLQDLQFSQVYNIQPFIGDDAYQNVGKDIAINISTYNLKPSWPRMEWTMNDNKELVCKAYYSCYLGTSSYRPVESITATVDGKNIEATLSEDGQMASINLGNIYKLNAGDYSTNITLSATNIFGSSERTITYGYSISETTARFPDDGMKDDCIRVCGIDWAKGIFYYDNTTRKYGIATEQWSKSSELGQSFFPIANGQRRVGSDIVLDKYDYANLKGDKKYDVVTQYTNTWGTPSESDFQLLVDNTSIQPCHVIDESGNNIPGFLFLFPSDTGKRFVSKSSVSINYKDVDKLGLFFPNNGYLYYNSWSNHNDLYYLSSTYPIEPYSSSRSIKGLFVLRGINAWVGVNFMSVNFGYQFIIRPVKL